VRNACCAHCGEMRRCGRDHIPPRALFHQANPGNLITVPCCEPCRLVQPLDDEYFRAAVISCERVFDAPLAQSARESFLRSLTYPESQGFATSLSRNVIRVVSETAAGIYLGDHLEMQLEVPRINRVSQRIVRGLFCHERKRPLPQNYEVIGRLSPDGIDSILEILKREGIMFPPIRSVGNGVFEYTFRASEEDLDSTILLALFYQHLYFVGFTRQLPERRASPAAALID